MKNLFIPMSLVASVLLSSNIQAAKSEKFSCDYLNCKNPVVDYSGKSSNKYPQFTATINCSLILTQPLTGNLSDIVLNYIKNSSSFKIDSIQANAVYKGREGFKLNLIEYRNTGHGFLNVSSNTYVVSDDNNHFLWESISNKMDGNGDAKYTKSEQKTVEISNVTMTSLNFIVSKVVEIKKPTFAPDSMFENGVKSGLSVDMKEEADDIAKMLANKNNAN